MKAIQQKLLIITAGVTMFCLAGLVMSGTAFARQCVDNGDGTVTDISIGLMWQKDTAGPMNWDAAMSYAFGLTLAGRSGWRLPDRDELARLYHSECKILMRMHSNYWSSSTPYPGRTDLAWRVDFNLGDVNLDDKSNSYHFRAIRLAQ